MKKLHIARYFFTTICIVGVFTFTSSAFAAIKPDGTAQIGDACNSSSQCVTGNCEDSYCVCNDKDASGGSAHCAARYFGQPGDWRCLDDSEDDRTYHGDHLQFCQRSTFLGGTRPEISDENVKYPQDKKSLMGHACNSTANCITDNSDSLDSWCEETQFDSSNNPSSPYYDPWYTPNKKLKVCECGGDSLSKTSALCALQYGGTASDWPSTGESAVSVCRESTSSDLEGLLVCRKSNDWMPKTLVEMRSSVAPRDDNSVQTTFLGFDISTEAPELVTPETKIGIPGVFFTNITKETHITTDESGSSWLNIPFLGEFISAIYKYSVGLISLIAVMVLIISGVQIITSAGNSEAISSAKHRIVSSVIAIVITAGSYTILYTVNPDLVNLKNLKILVVPQKLLEWPEIEASETVNSDNGTQVSYPYDQSTQTTPGTAPPTTPSGSTLPRPYTGPRGYVCGLTPQAPNRDRVEDCRQWCSQHPPETWPEQSVVGSMPISETQLGLRAPGIRTSARIPKMLVEPLKAVGLKAQAHPDGPFTVQINSSWRSLQDAIKRVCTKFPNNTGDLFGKLSAPGANAHNYAGGGAVDTILFDKNNEPITNPEFDTAVILQENSKTCTGSGQNKVCTSTGDGKWKLGNKILAELFYSVVGWKRFTGEVWHFDYNTASGCRTNTCTTTAVGDSGPALCTCKQ